MNTGKIYIAVNNVSGKKYVGLTRRSIHERWLQHVNVAHQGPKTYFHRAIVKYGADAFSVTQLASSLTLETLSALERQLIEQHAPEYNQTSGGEVTLGRKYDDTTKERIRRSNTGKKRTPEQCRRASEIKKQQLAERPDLLKLCIAALEKARGNPEAQQKRLMAIHRLKGSIKLSPAHKEKFLAGRRLYGMPPETREKIAAAHRIPIWCSNGTTYSCIAEAALHTGVSKKSISRVCNGEYASVRGVQFRRVPRRAA